jgi:membrane protease YdiL (CAAX protease family)
MYCRKKITNLTEAILCCLGLMLFSFFINFKLPLKLLSFTALIFSALIISKYLKSIADLKGIFGENHAFKRTLLYVIFGITAGTGLAVFYRWYQDLNLFPDDFHLFVITAALIGCMEEMVFRGFLQGFVERINAPLSVLFSTLSHTGYKCCLFLSPAITGNVDVWFLAIWTFGAGLLFGTIRYYSKSLLPALSAHALFDIIAYAGFTHAPWWVW